MIGKRAHGMHDLVEAVEQGQRVEFFKVEYDEDERRHEEAERR